MSAYTERCAREGRVLIEAVMPSEDGGTGDRWNVTWSPDYDSLPDIDAGADTIEQALVNLALGLGEEVITLRAKLAEITPA